MKPNYVFLLVLCCILSSVSQAKIAAPAGSNGFRVRAVNLGGWLVTEGWIKPSLFDAIPNKDLLDGTTLQFKSVTVGKYLCAESGGGTILVANSTDASEWETFSLWRINENTFNLRVLNRQFVGLDTSNGRAGVNLVAVQNTPGISETFQILRNSDDPNRVRIKASNGFFLQKHWKTFIVKEDFKWISKNGLNAVRIPVGWWIAYDPNPPKPFVGGSLKALDNAFLWAKKYGVKVIIDLHAAPGSQNGWEHSASRDGSQEWGNSPDYIRQTVAVIDFLTARYAQNPSLYAVELLNEPRAPGVSLETVTEYYKAGYEAVRKHSSTAYVVMCNRLGPASNTELLAMAGALKGTVVDVHYYNLFIDLFSNMTAQQNIDYVYNERRAELSDVTTSNGPLSFVGEWVAEWTIRNQTKEDYQRYAKAQLEVFGGATFGWAYWGLKNNVTGYWSLEWMIKNGYIKL
nr:probable glucan 1,3-beta-glucosidase A [Ipomoea batatas]